MSAPAKGLGVGEIEGSRKTCGKIYQINRDSSWFTPGIPLPFLSGPKDTKYLVQVVIDDAWNRIHKLS